MGCSVQYPESNIPVSCSACEKRFRVKATAIGRQLACPYCKSVVVIRGPSQPIDPPNLTNQQAKPGPPPAQFSNTQAVNADSQISKPQRIKTPRNVQRRYPVLDIARVAMQTCSILATAFWIVLTIVALDQAVGLLDSKTKGGPPDLLELVFIPWFYLSLRYLGIAAALIVLQAFLKLAMDVQDNTWIIAHDRQ